MMAADKDLPGLFRHGAAVVPGDRVEGPGNVVVAEQMLDKILRHGGQTVGVLDVFVVIVAVEKAHLAGAGVQDDAGLVKQYLADDALLQAGGAAFGGALGG